MGAKFLFFGCIGNGFYDYAYSDLKFNPDVLYYRHPMDSINSHLLRIIGKLIFRRKDLFFSFPVFKNFIYEKICSILLANSVDAIILFYPSYEYLTSDFVEYVKNRYPKQKFVLYFQDIVNSYKNPKVQIGKIKKMFDLILSYDINDSLKYKFNYYPTPFSMIDLNSNNQIKECDVYFCGKAKTRFPQILEVYRICIRKGLKCNFFIFGLPEKEQYHGIGLYYDIPVSYYENLQRVSCSKCQLEILQDGACGYTPRIWECIAFDKKLLTNNNSVVDSEYYKTGNIYLINNSLDDIDSWINAAVVYSKKMKESLSPNHMLSYIQKNLI